jgi:hypothetical protein
MSPPQQPFHGDDGRPEAIETARHALPSKTLDTTTMQDPEALTSIELSAANDPNTQQKRDDPYLVCFDEAHDAEK